MTPNSTTDRRLMAMSRHHVPRFQRRDQHRPGQGTQQRSRRQGCAAIPAPGRPTPSTQGRGAGGAGPGQNGRPLTPHPARTPTSTSTHPFSHPPLGSWTIPPGPGATPKACVPLSPPQRSQGPVWVSNCLDGPTLPSEQCGRGAWTLPGNHLAPTSTPAPGRPGRRGTSESPEKGK